MPLHEFYECFFSCRTHSENEILKKFKWIVSVTIGQSEIQAGF